LATLIRRDVDVYVAKLEQLSNNELGSELSLVNDTSFDINASCEELVSHLMICRFGADIFSELKRSVVSPIKQHYKTVVKERKVAAGIARAAEICGHNRCQMILY